MTSPDPLYALPSEEQLLTDFESYLRDLDAGDVLDEETGDIFDRWIAARQTAWTRELERQRVAHARWRDSYPLELTERLRRAEASAAVAAEEARLAQADADAIGRLLADLDPHDRSI